MKTYFEELYTNKGEMDARVRKDTMFVCSFGGQEFNHDKTSKCKLFTKATRAERCMYFREDIRGACDCSEK